MDVILTMVKIEYLQQAKFGTGLASRNFFTGFLMRKDLAA